MSRFKKLLGAVALLGISLAACEEPTPPPPVGSIVGTVSIEGTGIDGVSVNLSNGNSTTTSGGGSYRFDNVEGGAYTVTISGYPSDATFDATSAAATISSAGQSVTLNFSGAYIRTASVMGSVTVENMGLGGVTVALSGVSSASAVTDDTGQYAFTGLRMGNYSVEISGFDSDEVGFSATAAAVTVGTGESKVISFDGTYLRTAGIMGRVSVEGEGLEGVNVSLTGGPDATDMTTMTDASGQYSFAKLRAGDYAVGISGYDTDDYEFATTSQNVTIALGETATVPFEGVLLRTAGVSGRVSVEGIGLEGVTVTLSMADADDMTAMTDAGGLYAFSGLAAGDYTVAIALSEEQMAAYVFDMTSMDVTLVDDMTSIVNFEAEHAATASVTVQLFVDEGPNGRNDMMDEGEGAFPTEAMLAMVAELGLPLALPISLAGPGVHDMQDGTAMPDGSVVFSGLKAGDYQVIVTDIPADVLAALPPALGAVLRDYAHGGPATGYMVELGVGQAAMQYAPVDITHQTVNLSVTLKSGDETGDMLPGATVNLYADMDGDTKIGSDETDEMGMAAIRVERSRTNGHMAYVGVEEPDGFDVDGDMQMVEWDPQSPMSAAANSQDIVNLKAEVSFAGKTIMTAMGGGKALGGWGIDVTMMGDDGMEAVEGAPEMLDDEGMGSFTMMAGSAADLPMTYYVTFDADQEGKDADDKELDGGESYETVDTVMHTHTGLSVDTEMDAGTMTARYTTQTLMVSVYREVDQVPGFTGNIGAGDMATTCFAEDEDDACITGVELELRHETPSNRRNNIDPDVWKWDTSGSDRTVWVDNKGNYTFRHLPTDHNIFVLANEIGHVEIVPTDNLAAYENREDNGIEGSAFGPEGGYGHTVSLCPERKVDPTDQDHGDCGSFGFVLTLTVAAHVKKMIVKMDDDDGFEAKEDVNVKDVALGLTPVTGKNIAGDAEAVTTLKSAVRSAGETSSSSTWDDEVDERQDLYFGRMAEGVYGVSLTSGWGAYLDGDRTQGLGKEFRLKEEDEEDVTEDPDRTGAMGPFRPGDDTKGVYLEVRPTTGTLYGVVENTSGDPLEDVEVTVNGVTVKTDIDGRYIVPDYSRMASRASSGGGKLYITVSKEGFQTQRDDPNNSSSRRRYQIDDDGDPETGASGVDFAANDPMRLDIVLTGSTKLATVTGTVTDKDGDPVSGVDITVTDEDGKDVLNNRHWLGSRYCAASGRRVDGEGDLIEDEDGDPLPLNCRRTGDDGMYELHIVVTDDDLDYTITPSKTRYYFDDPYEIERLEVGDTEDDLDFEALRQSRIRGSVRDANGGGMEDVTVTATAQGRMPAYAPFDETNANGRFTIWVDGDERYDVTAISKKMRGVSFTQPDDADGLRVDDDETIEVGVFKAVSAGALNVRATREREDDDESTTDVDESKQRWGTTIAVTYTSDADNVPDGYNDATYLIQTNTGADGAWTAGEAGTAVDRETTDAENFFRFTIPTPDAPIGDGEFMVRVVATAGDDGTNTPVLDDLVIPSEPATVTAVDPSASDVTARRQETAASTAEDPEGDFIRASWTAVTNAQSDFRVVAQVTAASTGGNTVWVVLAESEANNRAVVSVEIGDDYAGPLDVAIASGTGANIAVTAAELRAAIKIAVESLQGTVGTGEDDPKWTRSDEVDLAARES